jgi:dolichol-phosphate mannosyltransferase
MTLLVILPTYNERENLPTLVPAVLEQGAEILVADDQSPDGTGALADELAAAHPGRVHVLHRTGEKGFALSYIDGMRWAIERNYDLICQMDADWSHDPKYLPAIAEASATHDVVIGSRYVNGVSVVNWPLRRIFLSSFANWYIRTLTGLKTRDCTAGFRCWRRAKLAEVMQADISSDGYAFQVEMLWKAARVGCRITEVPIIFVERQQGQSKLSTKVLMESLLMPWRLRVRSLLSR